MDIKKIDVVTTCKADDLPVYGIQMINSFMRNWPVNIDLHFVGENDDANGLGICPHKWPEWFIDWKHRHTDNKDAHGKDPAFNRERRKDYDFKRDCVRFSHKVAAITAVATAIETDVLIWMDADVMTRARVTHDWLNEIFPEPHYMAWLDRARNYPECGFFMMRASHEHHATFITELEGIYKSDRVFELEQTHDSFVIENIIHRMVAGGYINDPVNLSGPAGRLTADPFPLSVLGQRMVHLKGKKKYEAR